MKNNRSSHGLFLGLLFAICNFFARVFKSGIVYRFLSSHEKDKKAFASSATAVICRLISSKSRKYTEAVKKFIAGQFERSFMLRLISSAVTGLVDLPGRVIGAFGMTWGAYVVLIYLIKKFALFDLSASAADLVSGCIVCLASLPMAFSDKSLRALCNESPLVSSLLMKVFGVPCEILRSGVTNKAGQSGAVIFGIITGLLTYFIPPLDMIYGMVALVIVALIFAYPEGGVIISIAISPVLGLANSPSITLAAAVLLTAIAYFIKVLRGKRVFKIGITGFVVYAFMTAVFLSGFAPGDSNTMENALLCCSLMLIFPLIVNMMKYRHWINACVVSFVVPSGIVAFIGIAQYLLGLSPAGWIDSTLFSGITFRAVSLFNNPNIFGVYLVALFPMALMLTLPRFDSKIRVLGGIVAAYIAIATIFTYSRSSWLALIAGAMLFAILVTPKGILWLVPVAAVVVALSLLFPDSIGARLINFASFADSANNYRVDVWNSSWDLLTDTFWFGIGWGEEAFKTAYINYGTDGASYAMHSHSLFIQLAVQTGAVGLVLFVISIVVILRKCIGAAATAIPDCKLTLYSKAALTGALGIIIAGVFDYTWYNFRVFFIFWALLGLASAAINVCNSENETPYSEIDEYACYITVPIPRSNEESSDPVINKEE